MKGVTTEEMLAFYEAMKKNNLSYRTTPRSQEEIDNMVFVHNSATREYYSVKKGTVLSDKEKVVTPFDIFANMTKDIDVIYNENDDKTM